MSERKHLGLLELFAQARDGYNLVLGGMLGAYLGLTISRTGLSGGSYFDLGLLLIGCCFFVICINNVGDRFHRNELGESLLYVVGAVMMGTLTYLYASEIGTDPKILLTVFIVWALVILFEVLTALADIVEIRRGRW